MTKSIIYEAFSDGPNNLKNILCICKSVFRLPSTQTNLRKQDIKLCIHFQTKIQELRAEDEGG